MQSARHNSGRIQPILISEIARSDSLIERHGQRSNIFLSIEYESFCNCSGVTVGVWPFRKKSNVTFNLSSAILHYSLTNGKVYHYVQEKKNPGFKICENGNFSGYTTSNDLRDELLEFSFYPKGASAHGIHKNKQTYVEPKSGDITLNFQEIDPELISRRGSNIIPYFIMLWRNHAKC